MTVAVTHRARLQIARVIPCNRWPALCSRSRLYEHGLSKPPGNNSPAAPIIGLCDLKVRAFGSTNKFQYDPRAEHIMDTKVSRIERVPAHIGGPIQAITAMGLAAALTVGHITPNFASRDAAHGATIYHGRMVCHSLDTNG